MTGRDEYYNRSKQEGYRARSAYKLKQLDEAADLLAPGDVVVDLGAAPGGWLQVAAEAVGDAGTVVGVDRQRIRPLDHAVVETLRGDMTEDATVDRLRETVGDAGADVVVSDMAPNMTGEYSVDHARSIHLARQALGVAEDVLAPGGDLVVKAFDGPDLADLRADMDDTFEYVRSIRPDASRDSSSEVYLVAKGYLTAPIAAGDELVVEIVDRGDEGDGIASVEGFTVFVPDAEVGDRIEVRIDEVKPRFAFAERV
ncbi:TRAM domain-containing protein [Haloplanus rallus]|uniref:Ribosomal RNA large subunit methyltransferase E n=1 Tax=Haloplanus rallus TaxID=1816183 RepID=A0A6B9F5J1_9EURY|nr:MULTISPECIES: 23S rRNA (uridine(2552)-2'-O)-methyltransferase [Haloplanus]QGX95638.1 TRAM domain-containing protein [Haloplanus rallus]